MLKPQCKGWYQHAFGITKLWLFIIFLILRSSQGILKGQMWKKSNWSSLFVSFPKVNWVVRPQYFCKRTQTAAAKYSWELLLSAPWLVAALQLGLCLCAWACAAAGMLWAGSGPGPRWQRCPDLFKVQEHKSAWVHFLTIPEVPRHGKNAALNLGRGCLGRK